MSAPTNPTHRWKFVRSGGLDQASLETADDLRSLGELDQKLWVVLSCPVKGLQVDERTLAIIDTDGDGHVRPPEVIAAVSWASARLKDPASLLTGGSSLPIEAIAATPEGAAIAETARALASRSGATDRVLAADAAEAAHTLSKGALKGDGILRPEAAANEDTRGLIKDIAACCGDVTAASIESFYSDLESFRAWASKGRPADSDAIGPAAAEAFAAVEAVRRKVDDYFARTQLAAFDDAAVGGLNRSEADFRAIAAGELAADSPALAAFPLARIEAGKPLPLLEGVNPAWAAPLARLQTAAAEPLLGQGTSYLTAEAWTVLLAKLAPYEAWIGTRPASKVSGLGIGRAEAILAGSGREALGALLAEDKLLAPRVAAALDVEKLALFYRDLGTLLRNFVNLQDFYSSVRHAVFQAGTLFLDSRSCRLCIQVDDFGAHAPFAAMSRLYVAYAECRRSGGQTLRIAAAFTQGDSDYLFVGRNGVFYDRAGRDWDATIVKVSEAPISIRQSFLSPYKKVAAFVGEQFAKFAASKEKVVEAKAVEAVSAAPAPPTAPAQAFDIAKFAGIFAAIGLAVGTIGGAMASVFSGFLHLPFYLWPVAVVGALLIISGPSMLLAALKLRQRNLGPLLEGTGWAVNGRVKINIPLGHALTDRGVLPPNSSRLSFDPYEDAAANTRRRLAVTLLVLAAAGLVAARAFHYWPF
jgi:hypothetical protein